LLIVPYFVGAVLVIIGWILTILAIKDISDAVQDRSIFNNGIVSVVLAIIGTAVFAVVVAASILGFIGLGILSPPSLTSPPPVSSDIIGLIAGILVGLLVVWGLAIGAAFFLWRSYKTVSVKLNMRWFGIGALIYLIGSILTIIFVGFVLIFIAQIIFVVAFFTLPNNPPGAWPQTQIMGPPPAPPTQSSYPQPNVQQPYYSQPQAYPPPATGGPNACANCGAPNGPGANFCDRCGTRLS
jgi:uncharacterized membrane protein